MTAATTHNCLRLMHPLGRSDALTSYHSETRYPVVAPGHSRSAHGPLPIVQKTCCSSGKGRRRGRIRHSHRKCHQINPVFELNVTQLNTQGLNWRLVRHHSKLETLLRESRRNSWDLVALSDLHFCDEDWCDDTRTLQLIFMEEFVFVQWYRVGFFARTKVKNFMDAARLPL